MKFRTEITIPKFEFTIDHETKILTIGSCFAENIAEYLHYYKFLNLSNPFGVLYNPVSILNSLKIIRDNKRFEKSDLIFDQSEWHSFYHHSDFSYHELAACLSKINTNTTETKEFVNLTDLFIISYGTAFVYRHKENNIIVSNCHKIPQTQFEKKLLSVDEILTVINETIALIHDLRPHAHIIFTISPVRHLRDGFTENQISKSNLFTALHGLLEKQTKTHYFPSYEVMMDDLRDYRYYAEDLVHPNKQATEYIWQKFSHTLLSDDCKAMLPRIDKINRAVNHRVRNPGSEKHQAHIEKTLKEIAVIEQNHPVIKFDEVKELFQSNQNTA